jgi:hypothetical protein
MVQFWGLLQSFSSIEIGVGVSTPNEIPALLELIRSEKGQHFQGPVRSCPFGQIIQCDFEFVQLVLHNLDRSKTPRRLYAPPRDVEMLQQLLDDVHMALSTLVLSG